MSNVCRHCVRIQVSSAVQCISMVLSVQRVIVQYWKWSGEMLKRSQTDRYIWLCFILGFEQDHFVIRIVPFYNYIIHSPYLIYTFNYSIIENTFWVNLICTYRMKKNIFVQSARFSHQRDTCTLLIVDLSNQFRNYKSLIFTNYLTN